MVRSQAKLELAVTKMPTGLLCRQLRATGVEVVVEPVLILTVA